MKQFTIKTFHIIIISQHNTTTTKNKTTPVKTIHRNFPQDVVVKHLHNNFTETHICIEIQIIR